MHDFLNTGIAVISFGAAAAALWWRATRRLHRFMETQEDSKAALDRLRLQVAHSAKGMAQKLENLADDVAEMQKDLAAISILLTEREKDVARLEAGLADVRRSLANGAAD